MPRAAALGYAKAGQIARHYDEFGPTYFVLAQIIPIWAISSDVLRHSGVEIPITVANRRQTPAAKAGRRALAPPVQ